MDGWMDGWINEHTVDWFHDHNDRDDDDDLSPHDDTHPAAAAHATKRISQEFSRGPKSDAARAKVAAGGGMDGLQNVRSNKKE